ncbi:MAG: HAD family phosphatase [Thermoguttaceae bacterium]|jgi:beta-phosphoglucomutase
MTHIYAAIFDMDGVLVDTYHAHFQSWLMMAERAGLSFTEAEFAPTFGRTSREIIAHFWGQGRYDDAQIAALDAEKEAAFREIIGKDFPAMPGVHKLLTDLFIADWRLAVGSSGPPENVELILDRLGKGDLFSAIVTGMDVTRGKPDPQVFLLAAERLGVPPSRCVVIEDAQPGIAAAQAAGMAAVGLVSTGRTREELAAADLVVKSLAEISPRALGELIDRGDKRSN